MGYVPEPQLQESPGKQAFEIFSCYKRKWDLSH